MVTRIIANLLRQGEIDARSWTPAGCAGKVNPHFVCDSAKIDGD
jgi:hypothetical protein